MKKYTNPYEFIHTQYDNKLYISKLKPLSRAYYKMVEILKTFYILSNITNENINSFHLAEGPGGFIEALSHIRNNRFDNYYGMTLINTDDNIPGWKKTTKFLKNNNNVHIEYGKDKTGNLYNYENLEKCWDVYGNKMDIITGDGGFDFSVDYNKQEQYAMRLVFTQIMYAILMQKHDGCFILKIFDVFLKGTIELLFILNCFYEQVHIFKPKTSRYANSEKYVVCKHFKYYSSNFIAYRVLNIVRILDGIDLTKHTLYSFLNIPIHNIFINKIETINAIYGQQQIENISSTINLIENTNLKKEKIEYLKQQNLQKCINWCKEHNIEYNNIQKKNIFKTY